MSFVPDAVVDLVCFQCVSPTCGINNNSVQVTYILPVELGEYVCSTGTLRASSASLVNLASTGDTFQVAGNLSLIGEKLEVRIEFNHAILPTTSRVPTQYAGVGGSPWRKRQT